MGENASKAMNALIRSGRGQRGRVPDPDPAPNTPGDAKVGEGHAGKPDTATAAQKVNAWIRRRAGY